jgi:hypothetical protein
MCISTKYLVNHIYMETFYIVVLSIAAILLIILLTFIGIIMGKQKTSQTFPSEKNHCPDFWKVSNDPSMPQYCVIPDSSSGLNCGTLYSGSLLTADMSNPSITPGFKSVKQPDNSVINYINFKDPGWSGGICAQKTWAKKYQIVWDGVTNYNSCT